MTGARLSVRPGSTSSVVVPQPISAAKRILLADRLSVKPQRGHKRWQIVYGCLFLV